MAQSIEHREISSSDVRAVSSEDGVRQLLSQLGYDVSEPLPQTAASLGTAERVHHHILSVVRVAAQRVAPGLPPALEVYWVEATALTADLRKAVAMAFRNKPANTLVLITTRDFGSIDFVFIEKSLGQSATTGGRVAVSHRLLSIDRRNPTDLHVRALERMRNKAADPFAQFDRIKDAFKLAEWANDDFNNRNLFSDYFLKIRLRIKELFPSWHEDVRAPQRQIQQIVAGAVDIANLAPADYAGKFIEPLLASLGFTATPDTRDPLSDRVVRAQNSPPDAPPLAVVLVYPWDRPLDRKDDDTKRDPDRAEDVPGIRVVSVLEEKKLNWAILTNGKDWRLYCAQAHSRASNYYEIDLPATLERDDSTAFRYFYLFFRAAAFVPAAPPPGQAGESRCFLDQLRAGSAAFAKEVGDRLRDRIFGEVFPYLAQGFVDHREGKSGEKIKAGDPFLNEVYDATLTLLYRLLFLLYAESLDLLPTHQPAYTAVGLDRLKHEIRDAAGDDDEKVEDRLKKKFSRTDSTLYKRLSDLFETIDHGSKDHNVPAYNGGLFRTAPDAADKSREAAAARFLKKHRVPDFYLARALDLLARDEDDKTHNLVFVDYKALGVRQLGSIYEGLLMYHVVVPRDEWEKEFKREGLRIALVPSNKERKKLGSYFTPQHIVKYIVANTVGPLLKEKFDAIAPKLRVAQREYRETRKFEHDRAERTRTQHRTDEAIAQSILAKHESAVWDLFDLKVLDPAMGSGHFLVETVDFITDKVLDFLAGFPWNPVQVLIEHRIRRPILDSLDEQGIDIHRDRLTDVNLIKRLVMKRCVYGVDLNPMAVELAKVSLWLDSFTLGAPLSFLDHHLKCGNSLIGSTIAELRRVVEESGSLFAIPMEPLERATQFMESIADLPDATIGEVTKSAETYGLVATRTKGYRALLDCLTAQQFGVPKAADVVVHAEALGLQLDDWGRSLEGLAGRKSSAAVTRIIGDSERISDERRFFHWDIDFPDVFFPKRRDSSGRAFDAIVGNPPYDVLKQDENDAELNEFITYVRSRGEFQPALATVLNIFRVFLLRAIEKVRSGGNVGMIVPLSLLGDASSAGLRKMLFGQLRLMPLHAFPQKDIPSERVFEEAKLSTVIVLAARRPPDKSLTLYVHRGRELDRDTPGTLLSLARLLAFDPMMASIPTGSAEECELALRLLSSPNAIPFREIAAVAVGEIDMTNDRDCIDQDDRQPMLVKGAHIQRYVLRETPKQGEQEFVSQRAFRAKYGKSPKAKWPGVPRVIFQGVTGTDDYRRIKACIADRGRFLANSVNFLVPSVGWDLHALLALLSNSLMEWRFRLTSANNNVNNYEIEGGIGPRIAPGTADHPARTPDADMATIARALGGLGAGQPKMNSTWGESAHDFLASAARTLANYESASRTSETLLRKYICENADVADLGDWTGSTKLRDLDYLGWDARFPTWQPDEPTIADGRWFPNGVAPPIPGNGPGDIPWDLIARVYPSYPLPGIDEKTWEAAGWEQFCDLLRKNKTRIGNDRIRADLTGRAAISNPTGPMRKLQETFLKFHREIRANRAKAAELEYLIDRIVFRLFDLTLDEQKLILSKVGPGRPLPPRRGKGRKPKAASDAHQPGLFAGQSLER